MLFDDLDFYAVTERDIAPFEGFWVGSDKISSREHSLVAVYDRLADANCTSMVFCIAAPARFYRVNMIQEANGNPIIQYQAETGSGEEGAQIAAFLASTFAQGNLSYSPVEELSLEGSKKSILSLDGDSESDGYRVDVFDVSQDPKSPEYLMLAHGSKNSCDEDMRGFTLSIKGAEFSKIKWLAQETGWGMLNVTNKPS